MLQQTEQWAAAAEIYRSILEAKPDHPDALHFSGVLAHQQAQSEQAVALIARSLELEPDRADWHSNLGIVLQDRLELDEATAAYETRSHSIRITQTLTTTWAWCCEPKERSSRRRRRIERPFASIPTTRTPTTTSAFCSTARAPARTALLLSKVITLQPRHPEARRLLALAHYTLGDVDKAVEVFEEWLRDEPDDPIARHMLAACSGRDVPPRASDAFIERTSTALPPASMPSSRSSSYRAPALVVGDARGRGRGARRRAPSTCSMPDVAPGSAVHSSHRTHGAWSESTCPKGCSLGRARGTSMTSWSDAS